MRARGAARELPIDTKRFQDKKNNHFEYDSVRRNATKANVARQKQTTNVEDARDHDHTCFTRVGWGSAVGGRRPDAA